MKTEALFLSKIELGSNAEGENLIVPLLLTFFIFGAFLMSSPSSDKLSPTLQASKKITVGSQSQSRKDIIDILWSCLPSQEANSNGCK